MNRRSFLKLAVSYAALRGADYAIGNSYSLPAAPFTDELTSLLLFLKTQTRLICMGDIDHSKPLHSLYLCDRKQLTTLGVNGFRSVFFEQSPTLQQTIDDLQNGLVAPQDIRERIFDCSWLANATNDKISDAAASALYDLKAPHFYAIDSRVLGKTVKTPIVPAVLIEGGLLAHHSLLPFSTAEAYWCMPGLAAWALLGKDTKNMYETLRDDTSPAEAINENMRKHKGAGLVVYGSGHFCEDRRASGHLSMLEQLEEADLNPIFINLFSTPNDKELFEKTIGSLFKGPLRASAADFFTENEEGKRIVFNDVGLKEAFACRQKVPAKNPRPRTVSRRALLSFRMG